MTKIDQNRRNALNTITALNMRAINERDEDRMSIIRDDEQRLINQIRELDAVSEQIKENLESLKKQYNEQ